MARKNVPKLDLHFISGKGQSANENNIPSRSPQIANGSSLTLSLPVHSKAAGAAFTTTTAAGAGRPSPSSSVSTASPSSRLVKVLEQHELAISLAHMDTVVEAAGTGSGLERPFERGCAGRPPLVKKTIEVGLGVQYTEKHVKEQTNEEEKALKQLSLELGLETREVGMLPATGVAAEVTATLSRVAEAQLSASPALEVAPLITSHAVAQQSGPTSPSLSSSPVHSPRAAQSLSSTPSSVLPFELDADKLDPVFQITALTAPPPQLEKWKEGNFVCSYDDPVSATVAAHTGDRTHMFLPVIGPSLFEAIPATAMRKSTATSVVRVRVMKKPHHQHQHQQGQSRAGFAQSVHIPVAPDAMSTNISPRSKKSATVVVDAVNTAVPATGTGGVTFNEIRMSRLNLEGGEARLFSPRDCHSGPKGKKLVLQPEPPRHRKQKGQKQLPRSLQPPSPSQSSESPQSPRLEVVVSVPQPVLTAREHAHESFLATIQAVDESGGAYTEYLKAGHARAVAEVKKNAQLAAIREEEAAAERIRRVVLMNNNIADRLKQEEEEQHLMEIHQRAQEHIMKEAHARPGTRADATGYHVQVAQVSALAQYIASAAVNDALVCPFHSEYGWTGTTALEDAGVFAQVPDWEIPSVRNAPRIWFPGSLLAKSAIGDVSSMQDAKGNYLVGEGDHLAFRYEVVKLLGQGAYAAVYLCKDHAVLSTGDADAGEKTVAVKIARSRPELTAAAAAEAQFLILLQANADAERRKSVVPLLDSFSFRHHQCLVFPHIAGGDLFSLLKADNFQGKSLSWVRRAALQLLEALVHLKEHGLVHCDIKPENVLVKNALRPELLLGDFGSAFVNGRSSAAYVQSRFYRAPEVLLRLEPEEVQVAEEVQGGNVLDEVERQLAARKKALRGTYSHAVDIWSLAVMLPELRSGCPSFAGESEKDQLHCIAELLGPPSLSMVARSGRRKDFFMENGELKTHMTAKGKLREPSSRTVSELGKARKEGDGFCLFLESCLRWEPSERLTAEQALKHQWLKSKDKENEKEKEQGTHVSVV